MFIGRTDTEAETPILWPPDAKCQLIGKGFGAGKDRDTLVAHTVKNLSAMQEM